ncbi:hypothetical protein [Streptomyces sp. NPDC056672]|uniref:hypothetical protein n=1 Tax=Streptomyces sp. NPDC056672 TaxID=3345906 RepID=UPI0036BF96C7
MLKHRIRTTALAATALVAALSLTACQNTTDSGAGTTSGTGATSVTGAASNTGATSGASAENAAAETSKGSDSKGSAAESGKNGSAAGESTAGGSNAASGAKGSSNAGSGDSNGSGDKNGYGQVCGANDISWSTRAETQAGGYILIIAKAKSGITCVLPAALPTVAFGSDGTEAGPAEQAVGPQITLKRGVTAYAGVNPKTTNDNWGKELNSIIVAIGNEDPNPVSLPVGKILVADPIVTNWHTSAADAVPFSS